jgi:hypothetical protein
MAVNKAHGLSVPKELRIELVARRVHNLSPRLRDVLACMADDMPPTEIVKKLGYANIGTVNSVVSVIYGKLGLQQLSSRTEKRALAINAFKQDSVRTLTVCKPSILHNILNSKMNAIDGQLVKVKTLLSQGYEVHTIEIQLRRRPRG